MINNTKVKQEVDMEIMCTVGGKDNMILHLVTIIIIMDNSNNAFRPPQRKPNSVLQHKVRPLRMQKRLLVNSVPQLLQPRILNQPLPLQHILNPITRNSVCILIGRIRTMQAKCIRNTMLDIHTIVNIRRCTKAKDMEDHNMAANKVVTTASRTAINLATIPLAEQIMREIKSNSSHPNHPTNPVPKAKACKPTEVNMEPPRQDKMINLSTPAQLPNHNHRFKPRGMQGIKVKLDCHMD
jgi:hypothetical protein